MEGQLVLYENSRRGLSIFDYDGLSGTLIPLSIHAVHDPLQPEPSYNTHLGVHSAISSESSVEDLLRVG